jgi:hypothetical protein
MTRTFTVTVLAVLLAVVMLASSAWAECAWVMWVRDAEEGIGWRTAGGFTSQGQCLQEVRKNVKETYPPPEYSTAREAGFSFAIFRGAGENTKLIRLLQCLPDTVDPRGAKEGGR